MSLTYKVSKFFKLPRRLGKLWISDYISSDYEKKVFKEGISFSWLTFNSKGQWLSMNHLFKIPLNHRKQHRI